MNIAEYAMSNKRVIHFFLVIMLLGGIVAFNQLGKQEDAPFVIKMAILTTTYPGASAEEVEELITDPIERELQDLSGVDYIKSESRAGISIIKLAMDEAIPQQKFEGIWDQLRRKTLNVQSSLPPEASTIAVNDDFGAVFGIYYAITVDDGYSYAELEDYAKLLQRELVTIGDVGKVTLFGVQPQVVNIELSSDKISNAGILPREVVSTLSSQNKLIYSGKLPADKTEIRVDAKGTFQSIEEIGELIIRGQNGNEMQLMDLADITRDYQDPPVTEMRVNGQRAIGIGISTRDGGNSVTLGESVRVKLDQLMGLLPVGAEVHSLYAQDIVAVQANNDFIKNLFMSVGIVILVILLAMGFRAGLLIGSSLVFCITGTLLLMMPFGIDLHRTSLAAIIVAMGMLVDNAIVVTDNAQSAMKRGIPKRKALIDGASLPQWGLLGATFIAIISFYPLYAAPSNTAEIIKPLFIVLAISLILSWFFALIQTTVYGELILKMPKIEGGPKDPLDTKFLRGLRRFLETAIAFRWITILVVVGAFATSIYGYRYVKQAFFPAVNKPLFKGDYFLAEGARLDEVREDIIQIEDWLMQREEVVNVSITIGSTPLRYYLASISWPTRPQYANLLIETTDFKVVDNLMPALDSFIIENFPDAHAYFYKFKVSPAPDAIIEPTFMGPDTEVLRDLAEQAKTIMRDDPTVKLVRDSWGNKTMNWAPVYSQLKGQQAGVSREVMAASLRRLTMGQPVGEYREGDNSLPILVKDADRDAYDYGNIGSYPLYNDRGDVVQLDQVVESYDIGWENWSIKRFNRQRAIAAWAEPLDGIESPECEASLMPKIDSIYLPEGYSMFWDGMYFTQTRSQQAIALNLPLAIGIMITILVVLFNSYRKPLVIMAMVPFILIGVVGAFLLIGNAFGFFAVLGLLGLIGMVIKNAVVLIDQSELEMKMNGLDQYNAIVTAAQSRAIPVAMAAVTTILGMVPLLPDPMFGGMAVTIMGGLAVATILTIIVLPVLYATVYRLRKPKTETIPAEKPEEETS
jgi:multidrug efflux pump subunit AcrB